MRCWRCEALPIHTRSIAGNSLLRTSVPLWLRVNQATVPRTERSKVPRSRHSHRYAERGMICRTRQKLPVCETKPGARPAEFELSRAVEDGTGLATSLRGDKALLGVHASCLPSTAS